MYTMRNLNNVVFSLRTCVEQCQMFSRIGNKPNPCAGILAFA